MTCVPRVPHPQRYPQPKGQKKKKIVKYGMGGLIILFLVAIIWFPLLFMSLVRSVVGVVNQPTDVTVTLKLGGYEVSSPLSGRRACPPVAAGGLGRGSSPSATSPCPHRQPLFTMSAQQPSIVPFTRQAYEELSKQFDPHPVSAPPKRRRRDGRGPGCAPLSCRPPPSWPCSSSASTAPRTSSRRRSRGAPGRFGASARQAGRR